MILELKGLDSLPNSPDYTHHPILCQEKGKWERGKWGSTAVAATNSWAGCAGAGVHEKGRPYLERERTELSTMGEKK